MTQTNHPKMSDALVRLRNSGLTLQDPAEDVRGHKVLDRDNQEIGKVDELFVDESEGKVRFLELASGGFLGMGEHKTLIPVDAITRIHDDHIHIDQARGHVAGAPKYDPETVDGERYWNDLYTHYGYPPFWAAGYTYPGYPFYV